MTTSKQLAAKTVATLPAELPEDLAMMMADAGRSDFGRDDVAIPRISLLQDLSPQVDKKSDSYIKGAESGQFYDPVRGTLATSLRIIPVFFHNTYVEWRLRTAGGGLVRDLTNAGGAETLAAIEAGRLGSRGPKNERMLTPDTELLRSAEYFVLIVNEEDGSAVEAVITLNRTQLKHARRWNSQQTAVKLKLPDGTSFTPPMFGISWKAAPAIERDNTNAWYVWTFSDPIPVPSLKNGRELYTTAKRLRELIESGAVKAAPMDDSGDTIDPNTGEVHSSEERSGVKQAF